MESIDTTLGKYVNGINGVHDFVIPAGSVFLSFVAFAAILNLVLRRN